MAVFNRGLTDPLGANGVRSGPHRTLAIFHAAGVCGPARSLVGAMAWFRERGAVEFLVPGTGVVAQTYSRLGLVRTAPYESVTYPRRAREIAKLARRFVSEVRTLRREIRRSRPDLVVVVTTSLPAALVAARLERVPAVVYAAEIYGRRRDGYRALPSLAAKCLSLSTARLADGIVSCSRSVARQFEGTRHPRIEIAYPPIEDEVAEGNRSYARERWGLADEDECLAVVGNISQGRGQDVAIRALALMRSTRPRARLLVVGAPHPRAIDIAFARSLRTLVRELGLDGRVAFVGEVSKIGDVYAAADLVINPATALESFGRVAAEALLAGKPVVSSRVGAVEEVLRNGVDALLVSPNDPHALATAVGRLLDDARLASTLVESGRARVGTLFGTDQDLLAWSAVVGAVAP